MSKATKIWITVAALTILLGILLFVGAMTMLKWDFLKLSTSKYVTNEHEILEDFSEISIKCDTADLSFALSEDGKCKVVCYEEEKARHSVSVQNGVLTVNVTDEKSWIDHIGFHFGSPKVTVYLPHAEYGALEIKTSTGFVEIPKELTLKSIEVTVSTGAVRCFASATEAIQIKTTTGAIRLANISAASLSLSVSTGNITASGVTCAGDVLITVSTGKTEFSDVRCKTLTSTGNTGSITLRNVIATDIFSIERSTGDVKFDTCDAAEILVKTDTGDVLGSLLSDKIFIAKTDTGSVNVPKNATGGRCEITTDTGDIKITINK